MQEKVDIVIPWVDGNDITWLNEKSKYVPGFDTETSKNRYRDWGLLKYWFRGIEQNATWVNKVYFVTWGHVPEWLNKENSKLVIVNHKDYMPEEYLPTFNSNTILMNLNKIPGLSENFVVFNDDTYLINKTKKEDFFKSGKPYDSIALNVHCPTRTQLIQNICINDTCLINSYFDFKTSIKRNIKLWLNPMNGTKIFRTLVLLSCPRFPGFYQHHLPQGYCKSTFDKIWNMEQPYLDRLSKNKYRTQEDVNEWLVKNWQIAEGNVVIRKRNLGKIFHIDDNEMPKQGKKLVKIIKKKKYKCVGLNDAENTGEKSLAFIPEFIEAFEEIYPNKSSFEV